MDEPEVNVVWANQTLANITYDDGTVAQFFAYSLTGDGLREITMLRNRRTLITIHVRTGRYTNARSHTVERIADGLSQQEAARYWNTAVRYLNEKLESTTDPDKKHVLHAAIALVCDEGRQDREDLAAGLMNYLGE